MLTPLARASNLKASEDLGNTTGQWDLYGSDAPSPYIQPSSAPFTKRGLLLKFLILGGACALTYLSATAPDDVLPIKKGPPTSTKTRSS